MGEDFEVQPIIVSPEMFRLYETELPKALAWLRDHARGLVYPPEWVRDPGRAPPSSRPPPSTREP